MKTFALVTTLLLTSTLAFPAALPNDDHDAPKQGQCVQPPKAQKFVERYIGFFGRGGSDLGDAKATGEALIADDIEQYSFSINSVQGKPVKDDGDNAGLVQKGKPDFLKNVLENPRLPPKDIKTLDTLAACDDGQSKIIWHWQFGSVGDEKGDTPTRGFTLFTVVHDDGPGEWRAKRIDIEFDSITWAANGEDDGH